MRCSGHTRETREKETRESFVCVIQLFLSPMFFVRETIKIFMFSLSLRGFVGLPVSFLSHRRRSSLSSSSLLSRLVRERGSKPVVRAGVSSRIGTRGSNGGNDQGC